MPFSTDPQGREEAIIELFRATFTASEGAEEGTLIGDLVHNSARQHGAAGSLRLHRRGRRRPHRGHPLLKADLRAGSANRLRARPGCRRVATDQQGQGIGQRLLNHGLAALRGAGVDIAMTYGDPGYYAKVGFRPISEADAPAPFKLQAARRLASAVIDRPADDPAHRSVSLRRGTQRSGILVGRSAWTPTTSVIVTTASTPTQAAMIRRRSPHSAGDPISPNRPAPRDSQQRPPPASSRCIAAACRSWALASTRPCHHALMRPSATGCCSIAHSLGRVASCPAPA